LLKFPFRNVRPFCIPAFPPDEARRNLELNGFSGGKHGFVRADCLTWLTQAAAARRAAGYPDPAAGPARRAAAPGAAREAAAGPYDLIFLDAPTFSNSKSMSSDLDLQRDHSVLIRAAAALLSPQGILLFSTNFRRFKLDEDLTEEFLVDDITKQTIPPDFVRNPRIHRCFRITLPATRAGAQPRAGGAGGPRPARTWRSDAG